MAARVTIRVDPHVRERLEALAAERGMDPADLVAELVTQAETAQLVGEVNAELERLAQPPRRRRAEMRQLEATIQSWLRE